MASPLYALPGISTNFGLVPPENMGARALPIQCTLAVGIPQSFDLTKETTSGQIDNIQAIFVDNSANNFALKITLDGFTLNVPAFRQAILPVFAPNLTNVTLLTSGNALTTIIFLNFPTPFLTW